MPVIRLKTKRLAFPALAVPDQIGDGEPAYGGRLIIDPNDAELKLLEATIEEAAAGQWKDDAKAVLASLYEKDKVALHKTPYKNQAGKVYAGFEGMYNLGMRSASKKPRPSYFDKHGNALVEKAEIERVLYSGCYVHAQVDIWAQDNAWGRRINCTPLGLVFAADGDSFGGGAGPATAGDFSDLFEDASDIL